MVLDEPKKGDTTVETEEELTFLFDRKTITLVGELVIDFDDQDGFSIYDEAVPRSNCD